MDKENSRSAAGLRRSAIAERLRLREEWSALKEIDSQTQSTTRHHVLNKKQMNTKKASKKLPSIKEVIGTVNVQSGRLNRHSNTRSATDALRGVVALVEVGGEARALPLRAALTALGATVMPCWSPLITHLVWAEGGCRSIRARARALACSLVSALWVEACASASARLPERAFPSAARASDLPSPAALTRMLKKAEADNFPMVNLTDSDNKEKVPRLRISRETEQDTSADTTLDTSKDTSRDTSRDTSKDTSKDASRDTSKDTSKNTSRDTSRDTSKDTTTDIESRVNTAPRRALPKTSSVSPRPVTKSRRKLFTQKEPEMDYSTDEDENLQPKANIPKPVKPGKSRQVRKPTQATQSDRKELARAERMAKRFLAAYTGTALKPAPRQQTPRIVLTGMCRTERREVTAAILSLKGRIQRRVNKRTTHVILGSFQQAPDERTDITGITNISQEELSRVVHRSDVVKARTLAALCGGARGCRVLRAHWPRDCARRARWLHHAGYEVPHLRKLSQKARVERIALAKLHSEYAYDVFCGMRVYVTSSAEQRDAAIQLLNLCGAVVQNGGDKHGGAQHGGNQNGETSGRIQHGQGLTQLDRLLGNATQKRTQALTQRTHHALVTQNGEIRYGVIQNGVNEYDIKIGIANGEVSSKWVFDSVAAARMRTTRRYVVSVSSQARQMMVGMANFCIDDC